MRGLLIFILFFASYGICNAQPDGSFRKFLNDELAFTTKSKGTYSALAMKSGDHWFLLAVFADTGTLLKAYFKDKSLRIKDGPFTLYYQKNKKAFEGHYANNVQQGIWKYYHKNGQLKDSGMIKNNQLVNTWYSWYESGNKRLIANYLKPDSIPNDVIIHAIPQHKKRGLLDSDTTISYLHGQWTYFYDNGKQKELGNYRHGLRENEWTGWYSNGDIESQGSYHKNQQEGDWEYFYENGKPSTREKYKDNKVVAMECFDEEGKSTGNFCSILKSALPVLDRFVSFESYMMDNIIWPAELQGKEVSGVVKVSYTITKEGTLKEVTILETPHQLLANEVKRFLYSIKKWSPAISHNRTIDFTALLEVPFYR